MKILFVIALPIELKIIKQEIKKLDLREFQVDFLLSGAGNYNVIYNLKDYIDRNGKPDFLVNLGVCGKLNNDIEKSFLQIYRIKNLSDNKEKICPVYIDLGNLQSIACSERIITNSSDLGDEYFIDMESFGIDFISSKDKIPYIILKIPFDEIGEKSKNIELKELEEKLIDFFYDKLFLEIQNYLNKNKKSEDTELSYYKNYFKLTFGESEIFKRNYYKFIAYKLDFNQFFEENKNLSKDKFLEEIMKI